jgi:predicted XRE-type DNA-binding protein
MARETTERINAVTRSSGNVFADLGFTDADERQTKVRLAIAINRFLQERRLSQTDAARLLGINQPKISALSNYRLAGFSVERLMHFLTALDRDIEIVIRRKPAARRAARIVVTVPYPKTIPESAAFTRRRK